MMMNDFINYAETLSNEEIDSFISKLTQVKENRADKMRCAAQKVKDAISEYLKLGGHISIEGEVWNQDWARNENVEATFNGCFGENEYLTILFAE